MMGTAASSGSVQCDCRDLPRRMSCSPDKGGTPGRSVFPNVLYCMTPLLLYPSLFKHSRSKRGIGASQPYFWLHACSVEPQFRARASSCVPCGIKKSGKTRYSAQVQVYDGPLASSFYAAASAAHNGVFFQRHQRVMLRGHLQN